MILRRILPLLFIVTLVQAQEEKTPTTPPSSKETKKAPASSPAPAASVSLDPESAIGRYPDLPSVAAAMKKAASFYRTRLSFAGGYATKWSRDLKGSFDSDRSASSMITIESPGTPTIGTAMLKAYLATGDKLYLQAAREVQQALLWTQLASGGWPTDHDFALARAFRSHYRRDLEAGDTDPQGRNTLSTLDDDKTQFAIMFLLEMAQLPDQKDDKPLHAALKFALDSLLAAQMPNGGWPQSFKGPADKSLPIKKPTLPTDWPRKWPAVEYTGYVTLNDGNLNSIAKLLIRAHEVTGEVRFMDALKKLGDFHILAQCPAPQSGWAQQYNANMEPVWARKFEPPSLSDRESLWAMETLHMIWFATGDDKYLAPIPAGLKWLESSRQPDGGYVRFYELHTNKPLYFVKDTYELTYDDSNLPTHYVFKGAVGQGDLDKFKALLGRPREKMLSNQAPPATPKAWLSKAKGAAQKTVTAMTQQNKEGIWTQHNMIEASLFWKHMNAMITYYEAASKAGPEFEVLRAKGK